MDTILKGVLLVDVLIVAYVLVKLAGFLSFINRSSCEEQARVEEEHRLALAEREAILRRVTERSHGRCGKIFRYSNILCPDYPFLKSGPWEISGFSREFLAEFVRLGAEPDDSVFVLLDMCSECPHTSSRFEEGDAVHRILSSQYFPGMEICEVFEVGDGEGEISLDVIASFSAVPSEGVCAYVVVCHPAIEEEGETSRIIKPFPIPLAVRGHSLCEEVARRRLDIKCDAGLAERVGIRLSGVAKQGKMMPDGEMVFDYLGSGGRGVVQGNVAFPSMERVDESLEIPRFDSAFGLDDEDEEGSLKAQPGGISSEERQAPSGHVSFMSGMEYPDVKVVVEGVKNESGGDKAGGKNIPPNIASFRRDVPE